MKNRVTELKKTLDTLKQQHKENIFENRYKNNEMIRKIESLKSTIKKVKKTIKFNQNKKINLSDNSLMCSIHSLPLNVICVNDHKKICGQCALNDIHLDHQIIPEQKFIEYVDELVKIFQQIENNQNDNIDINEIKANIILEKKSNSEKKFYNEIIDTQLFQQFTQNVVNEDVGYFNNKIALKELGRKNKEKNNLKNEKIEKQEI